MADQADNLRVLTSHIRNLASYQDEATGSIKRAGETIDPGIAEQVLRTHGVVGVLMSVALGTAVPAREAASTRHYAISKHLGESLRQAAENYNDVDYRHGRIIGACEI